MTPEYYLQYFGHLLGIHIVQYIAASSILF